MKIRVKGFLALKKAMGDQAAIEIEVANIALKGLLEKLTAGFGDDFGNMIMNDETRAVIPAEQRSPRLMVCISGNIGTIQRMRTDEH